MSNDFAQRIRERYPEGLTGIFAIGGTRTTYILDQNRHQEDPGKIRDFAAHGEFLLGRYMEFVEMFLNLGGQNMIITVFSFRGFYNRGSEYAQLVTQEIERLVSPTAIEHYHRMGTDVYFTGIDTLLLFPPDSPIHALGQTLSDFHNQWDYQAGRPKLIWEIASIPLYSLWQSSVHMSTQEQADLTETISSYGDELEAVYRELYRKFARDVYGTDVPMPHFYLGTNKSGDLKWRSPIPMSLSGGDYLRSYYTPYPTLFLTPTVMQAILEDLAFKERFFSDKTDYKGKFTRELAQAEYERVMALREDVSAVLGFSRSVALEVD